MIQSIDLTKLRNAEYIQFIRGTLQIAHLNDENLLKAKAEYDTLGGGISIIEAIFKTDQGSELTPIIEAHDLRRDNAVWGIFRHIESYTTHYLPAKVAAANVLTEVLKIYGTTKEIATSSLPAETAIVNSMVGDVTTKATAIAAATELAITGWFTELKTANDLLATTYILRTQELGGANPNTIKDKRIETNNSYYAFRDMIVAQATVSKNAAPFPKAISELNAWIEQFKLIITNRENDAARAAEKAKEEKGNG
jgi:hypothetical protein